MTLIDRLNSRAWEHRQHRALRAEAARRIAELEAALREARKAVVALAERERNERSDGWEAAELRWCRVVDQCDAALAKTDAR